MYSLLLELYKETFETKKAKITLTLVPLVLKPGQRCVIIVTDAS